MSLKLNRKYYLLLLMTFGLLPRLFFVLNGHYISPDGTQYASLGYHLFHDFQYVSNGGQFPDIIQPPLYPVVLGIFTLLLKAEYAGKLASLLFGLALIWAVFHFTERFSGKEKLAGAAALFVAFDPGLVAVSSQVASEALYLFLLFLLYAALYFYLQNSRLKQIVSAGLFTGLVYLTRPEGLLYFAVVLLILFVWRKPRSHILIYFVLVCTFLAGYSVAVYQNLGYWTLSPKVSFILAQRKVARSFLRSEKQISHEIDKKVQLQKIRYALAPDKKELAANALFWKKQIPISSLQKSHFKMENAHQRFRNLLQHAFANWILAFKKFITGLAFPWGFWLFLLFGLWRFPFKKWKKELAFTTIFLSPLVLICVANVEQRFLYIIPIILAPFLGRGMLKISDLLKRQTVSKTKHKFVWALLLLFIALSVYPGYAEIWQKTQAKSYYFSAGQWLKKEIPGRKIIAATVPQAVFFAEKRYRPLPYAPLDTLELYLHRTQVSFILLEDKDRHLRPGLYNTSRLPSFLQLVKSKNINNHTFWLLRVNKENANERTNAIN